MSNSVPDNFLRQGTFRFFSKMARKKLILSFDAVPVSLLSSLPLFYNLEKWASSNANSMWVFIAGAKFNNIV